MTIGIAHHNPQAIALLIDRLQYSVCTIDRDDREFKRLLSVLESSSTKPIVLLCDTVETVLRMRNTIKHAKLKQCLLCVLDNPDELVKFPKIRIVDAVQTSNSWRLFAMTQQAFNQSLLEAEVGCNIDEIEYGKYTFSECLKQLLLAILDDGNYYAVTTLLAARYRRGLKAAEENDLKKLIAKSELSQVGLAKLEKSANDTGYLDNLKKACIACKEGCDLADVATANSINVKDLIWVQSWKQFDTKKK